MHRQAHWVLAALVLTQLPTQAKGQATNTFPTTGNVGIGTTAPTSLFQLVNGSSGVAPANGTAVEIQSPYPSLTADTLVLQGGYAYGGGSSPYGFYVAFNVQHNVSGAVWTMARLKAIQYAGYGGGLTFEVNPTPGSPTTTTVEAMRITSAGYLGIGTTSPGAKLEVNGNVKLTSGSGASITYADGTQQSTAWTGVLCGGDYAEAVNASGGKKKYEPGDVLVLTSGSDGDVAKASEPYSTMVAGIYATKPGVIGRRQSLVKDSDEVPMAMVGIVPTKVSAENGPIHKGDLLVSSSAPGYAMKGTDRSRLVGAVIGKAMGSLDSGSGTIEVLVTLQ